MNSYANPASLTCAPTELDCLLVAFASMDGAMVDQHFASAQAFYLYAISAERVEPVGSQNFGIGQKEGVEPKLAWLAGADIVYCGSVGGSVSRKLLTQGIHPMRVEGSREVEDLVEKLQAQLKGEANVEGWLEKLMQENDKYLNEDCIEAMDDDRYA